MTSVSDPKSHRGECDGECAYLCKKCGKLDKDGKVYHLQMCSVKPQQSRLQSILKSVKCEKCDLVGVKHATEAECLRDMKSFFKKFALQQNETQTPQQDKD